MDTHHEFSAEAVENALAAAQAYNEAVGAKAGRGQIDFRESGEYFVTAECISITVKNNKVCLNLPLGIGSVCLPIPTWVPNGTAAQACLGICTTWGIPTGVKVTISALGHVIVQKTFGKC